MLDLVDILSVDELESAKQRCLKQANDHESRKQECLRLASELELKQCKLTVQPNHLHQPTQASSGTNGGSDGNGKRAVTVFKRNGTQLEEKGHFATCAKACRAIGLDVGGDSARRVLRRNGYVVDPQAA